MDPTPATSVKKPASTLPAGRRFLPTGNSWRRRLGVGVLLAILVAVGGQLAWQGWGLWCHRAAVRAISQRDFAAAQELLQVCRRVWPNSGETLLLFAQVTRRANALDDVPALLDAAERAQAAPEAITFERELLRLQRGDPSSAEVFLKFCDAQPQAVESRLILEALVVGSMRRLDLGAAGRYIQRWERNCSEEAEQVQGWIWLAELALSKGDVDEAASYYRRAVPLRPQDSQLRLRLAELLTRNAPRESLELLAQVSAAQPSTEDLPLDQARCYRSLGEHTTAEQLLTQFLAQHPRHFSAMLERGHVALDLRQFDVAEHWFRQALALEPDRREPNMALARCLQATDQTTEAQKYLAKVAQIDARVEQRIKQLREQGRVER